MSTANQLIYNSGAVAIDTTGDVITLKNLSGTSVGVISNSQLSLSRNTVCVLSQNATDTILSDSAGSSFLTAQYDGSDLANNVLCLYRGDQTLLSQNKNYTSLSDSHNDDIVCAYYDGTTIANNKITISRGNANDVLYQDKINTYLYNTQGNDILKSVYDGTTGANNTLILSRGGCNEVLSQTKTYTSLNDQEGESFIYATNDTTGKTISISRGRGTYPFIYQNDTTTYFRDHECDTVFCYTSDAQTLYADNMTINCPAATTGTDLYIKAANGTMKTITIAALKTLLGI